MAEPLILWNEVDRFLSLLGRSQDVHALVFPPKKGPGSDKGAKKLLLDEQGRQGAEQLLAMPLYRHHALGVRPNPGGAKKAEITSGVALWFEADGGLPLEAQEALPELIGLPEPTFSVWSGNKSLHHYWVGAPMGNSEPGTGGRVSPEEWRNLQGRLIAAVERVAPQAGVDPQLIDAGRVMRAPGGIHPATGERCRIHKESGETYHLRSFFDLLPITEEEERRMIPKKLAGMESMLQYMGSKVRVGQQPGSLIGWAKEYESVAYQQGWENLVRTYVAEDAAQVIVNAKKAKEALSYLPPDDFKTYKKWLEVGMALHSIIPQDLIGKNSDLEKYLLEQWDAWSYEMKEYYPPHKEQPGVAQASHHQLLEKWESFSSNRSDTIGLGSLIHWAKAYGYKPQTVHAATQDTTSSTTDTPSRSLSGVSGVSGVSAVGGASVRTLSTQERMGLLRDRVKTLVEDEATSSLDRLPVLREVAGELDLSVRDGELQKLIWEVRRRLAAPAEALGPGDVIDFSPIPWCWDGLLMKEATNLVVALPKAGKTSLLLAAIASWSQGEPFLGRSFYGACPPVLIVGSDQPQSDWGRMLQKVGLVSEDRRLLEPVVGLFHSGNPLSLDHEGIERIATYAKKHHGLLVLIDSYQRCVSRLGLSERDAEIAEPLADLQEALGPYGATIVVIHHSNKGSRNESAAMASRGSTALPAACSQILHLQRVEAPEGGQQKLSGKRVLRTEGRGGAPEEMLLEMDPEGRWEYRGSAEELYQEQERLRAASSLNDRQATALEHVEEVWRDTEGRQGISADGLASLMELQGADTARVARRLLEQLRQKGLVRKVVVNLGMGKGGLTTRYAPAGTADTSSSTPDTPDTADTPDGKREALSVVEEPLSSVAPRTVFEEFDSVELFDGTSWGNGWMVSAIDGEWLELVGVAGNGSRRVRAGLVRHCQRI